MAIRIQFGEGVGFAPVGAQLMERRAARRAASRARREAMEFQAEQADIAREMAAEQAEAQRQARAAAATQQQAAAFQRTALQVAGAGARQQVGIGAAQEAAVQGQAFKTGQEFLKFAIDKNVHSPSQLSRMTKLMADRASTPTDRTKSPQEQATALQTIDRELNEIWRSPAGELKQKEPTPQQDFDAKTVDWKGAKFTRDQNGVWKKIHEEKPDPAEAKAEATRAKNLSELQKQLFKLEADKADYIEKLDSKLVKGKRVFGHKEVRRMAAAAYNDRITAKQADIFAAEEGIGEEGGADFFPGATPFERGLGRAGVPEPTEAPPEPQPPPPPPVASPMGGMVSPAASAEAIPPEGAGGVSQLFPGARIAQTREEIKGSPILAAQAFRQLTPEAIQSLPEDAQRAYALVAARMETFMAQPGRAKIFGLQDMPFDLRAMSAAIVEI